MQFDVNVNTVLNGVIILGVGGVAAGVRGIYQQLRLINGRMISMEVWRSEHETRCEEMSDRSDDRHKKLNATIERVQRIESIQNVCSHCPHPNQIYLREPDGS